MLTAKIISKTRRRVLSRRRFLIAKEKRHAAGPSKIVDVGPKTKWANPFKVAAEFHSHGCYMPEITPRLAYLLFYDRWQKNLQTWPHLQAELKPLRGKILQCDCGYGEHCHAHVLRILANKPQTEFIRRAA